MTEHQHDFKPLNTGRHDIVVLCCAGCGETKTVSLPPEKLRHVDWPFIPKPGMDPVPDPWHKKRVWPDRPPMLWCGSGSASQDPTLVYEVY